MSTRRWMTMTGLLLATVTPIAALPTPVGGQAVGGCGVSLSPNAVIDGGPDAPGSPGTNREIVTTSFPYPRSYGVDNVDTDRDGTPDAVLVEDDGSVTVTNAKGTLRFGHPGVKLWANGIGGASPVGSDLAVFAMDDGGRGIGDSWAISGTLGPGTYDPAKVGIGVGPGVPFMTSDRNGDAVADLLVIQYVPGDNDNGTTRVVSGAAIASGTPGTSLAASATIGSIEGTPIGFAHFDGQPAGGLDQGGRIITTSVASDSVTLRVGDGAANAILTTQPETLTGAPYPGGGAVFAYTSDEGPLVSLSRPGPDGSVTSYWWTLDPACGAVAPSVSDGFVVPAPSPIATTTTSPPPSTPAPSAPGSASPAQPVPGTARFTG